MWSLPSSTQMVLNQARSLNQTVVLATGVFDLLHQEHRLFLAKAKQLGDVLLVGVESDARVKRLKGPDRPRHRQQTRVNNVMATGVVTSAFVLPTTFDTPLAHTQLVELIRPQFLAVSSHTPHLIEKRRILEQVGGKVVVIHQHNPDISTTKIIKNLASSV